MRPRRCAASERRALSFAHAVVANSAATARALGRIRRAGRAHHGRAARHRPRAGCAPGISPGRSRCWRSAPWCRARATTCWSRRWPGLLDLPWRLTIVGDCSRDPATVGAAQGRHRASPAGASRHDRGRGRGRTPCELYAASDLFVLPSRYEGFGMAYAEAIAHGLPVIGTTAGAIPETVSPDAGVLIPPDDVPALAAALRRLIENRRRARATGRRRPRWPPGTCPAGANPPRLFSAAIERVV